MQTDLPADFLATPDGERANAILRSCVHCGFCNATCPTYQVLGNELDGPRGRIYLIKGMLETGTTNATVTTHLDRCLTCRACETTCPSGVKYGELLEIGREFLERGRKRNFIARLVRWWLKSVVPYPRKLRRWLWTALPLRHLAPRHLRAVLRRPVTADFQGSTPRATRKMRALPYATAVGEDSPAEGSAPGAGDVLLLQGCVQRVLTPEVNAHLQKLLAARGIAVRVDPNEGCCGGLSLHLGNADQGRSAMERNLDGIDWRDAERIVSTATGCGVTLKEYDRILATVPDYAAAARRFAAKVCDVSELLHGLEFDKRDDLQRVAWHAPCSLQHGQKHGQKMAGHVEDILTRTGYELVPVRDAHLCCGSAGSYSMLQPEIARELKQRKTAALMEHRPDVIATANIGCQMHLGDGSDVPVLHWLQLLQ